MLHEGYRKDTQKYKLELNRPKKQLKNKIS